MGKNGNFLNLTANISNWVARSAKLQQTCFVRHFVERLLRHKSCFYDKNWARNGNFSGANEKMELMSLPISPIFFQLTFTGGNPWPNLVPTIPFGRKSGVFFCLQIEKVLCLLTSFSYTCTNFFFFWVFLPWKFLVFWTERSAYVQGYNKEHAAIEKWRFFLLFLSFIMKCFVLYTFETFKLIKVLKKVGFGLQNAHLKM